MYLIGRWLSRVVDFTTILSGLAIALMMFHVTADVIGRYFFNAPLPGTITIVAYYYMLVAAFLPLAFAEQKNAHVSVEVVTDMMPAFLQKHLQALVLLFSATVFTLLAVRTWVEARTKHEGGSMIIQADTSIPVWPTAYALPVGCGLMVLILLYKFLVYLFGARSGLDQLRATPDDMASATTRESDDHEGGRP